MKGFDAIIVRCNPGQIDADGGSQRKFDDGMRGMKKAGKQAPASGPSVPSNLPNSTNQQISG